MISPPTIKKWLPGSAPGPESPRLGVLGGAGQWAPHVGHAARAHSLARRPPAAGRQRGVRSGGAPLAATRLPARPPTATTWRPRQRDRRHRRTRCLVSPLARPPSFGRGALLARSQPRTHSRTARRAHEDPT